MTLPIERASDPVPPAEGGDGATLSSVFGYRIRSEIPFLSLRGGDGTVLSITDRNVGMPDQATPLMTWTGGEGPDVQLEEVADGYVVSIEDVGSFVIDLAEPSIGISGPGTGAVREARLFGLPLALCFAHRGDVPLHAAAVDVGGAALLFVGPRLYGKSTIAAAFLNAGYRPLSEDTACYRPVPIPSIVPGPAMLRIRPDVSERLGVSRARIIGEDPDRTYLVADEDVRGDTSPVPLKGVVLLRHGQDDMVLERVPPERSFPDLWNLSFHFPTDQDRTRLFDAITQIAREVPVWNLYRRFAIDTLPRLVEHIVTTCLGR
jgi:hypothetical protein